MNPGAISACVLLAALAATPVLPQGITTDIPDHVSLTNAGGAASAQPGALTALDRRLHPGASQADIKTALRTSSNPDLKTLGEFIDANKTEVVITPGNDLQVATLSPNTFRVTIGAAFVVSPRMITRLSPPLAAPGLPLPPIPRF